MASKITIDPRTIVNWTTNTEYRIEVTEGLVKEIGNNRKISPAITNQQTFTTFSSGPYTTASNYSTSTNAFISTATIVFNRQLREPDISTGNFRLVNTEIGDVASFNLASPEVEFDGNKTVKITLTSLEIPEGDYYFASDEGIFTDNFNFPNVPQSILTFSTGTSTWHQTTIANMSDENYNGNQINFPFSLDTPQVVDVDASTETVYTLTLRSPIGVFSNTEVGSTIDGVYVASTTKAVINQIFKDISFTSIPNQNDNSTYTYTLSKRSVQLVSKTLGMYGIPFTLGGDFNLTTSNKVYHWYKNIPLTAILTTSTLINGIDSGTATFKTIQKNGNPETNILFTTTFVNNVASTASFALASTGTYVFQTDWSGRAISPKYYGRSSNELVINAAERELYPGEITLSCTNFSGDFTIADEFKIETNYSTATNNSIFINDLNGTETTALKVFNFTENSSTFRFSSVGIRSTSSYNLQAYWEGQEWIEGQPFYPYFGTNSNILTVSERARYPGSLVLTGPSYMYHLSPYPSVQVTASLDTSTYGLIHIKSGTTEISNTDSEFTGTTQATILVNPTLLEPGNRVLQADWEGQAWDESKSAYPYYGTTSNIFTSTIIGGQITLSGPSERTVAMTSTFTVVANTNSVVSNTISLYDNETLLGSGVISSGSSTQIIVNPRTMPVSMRFLKAILTTTDVSVESNLYPITILDLYPTQTNVSLTNSRTFISNTLSTSTVFQVRFENELKDDASTATIFTLNSGTFVSQSKFGLYSIDWGNIPSASKSITVSSNRLNLGTKDFTIEAWVKPINDLPTYVDQKVISKSGINVWFSYSRVSDTEYNIYWFDGQTNYTWFYARFSNLVLGQWNHIFVTKSEGVIYLGCNGLYKKDQANKGLSPNAQNLNSFLLGGTGGDTKGSSGLLDSIRISDKAIYSVPSSSGSYAIPSSEFPITEAYYSYTTSTTYQIFDVNRLETNTSTIDVFSYVNIANQNHQPTGIVSLYANGTKVISTATTSSSIVPKMLLQPTVYSTSESRLILSVEYESDEWNAVSTGTAYIDLVKNRPIINLSSSTYVPVGTYAGKYLSPVTYEVNFPIISQAPGIVEWYVDNTLISTSTVVNGFSTLSNISVSTGSHNVLVKYSETLAYKNSNTGTFNVTAPFSPVITMTTTNTLTYNPYPTLMQCRLENSLVDDVGAATFNQTTGTWVTDSKFGTYSIYWGDITTTTSVEEYSQRFIPGVSPALNLGTRDFTIEAWVKPTFHASNNAFYGSDDAIVTHPIFQSADGNISFGFVDDFKIFQSRIYYSDLNNGKGFTSEPLITSDTWWHIFISRKDGVMYVGGNGIQYQADANTSAYDFRNFRLGGVGADGGLDSIRISEGALYWKYWQYAMSPYNQPGDYVIPTAEFTTTNIIPDNKPTTNLVVSHNLGSFNFTGDLTLVDTFNNKTIGTYKFNGPTATIAYHSTATFYSLETLKVTYTDPLFITTSTNSITRYV